MCKVWSDMFSGGCSHR